VILIRNSFKVKRPNGALAVSPFVPRRLTQSFQIPRRRGWKRFCRMNDVAAMVEKRTTGTGNQEYKETNEICHMLFSKNHIDIPF